MKKSLLIIFGTIGFVLSANATVRTVNNGTISAGQFTAVQPAIDASSAGDTIYIHGSVTSYGNIVLNKRLVLIGAGHTVSGTQYNLSTILDNISLSQGNSTTLPTGSVIKGMIVSNIAGDGGSLPVNNILIERTYCSNVTFCGNSWILRNDFISYVSLNNFNNIILSNNILTGYMYYSNKPSVIFTNNIFLAGFYFYEVDYASITNNFFFEPNDDYFGTMQQNTYNKNVFIYADPINYISIPPVGNTGVGNINTTANQFVSTIPLNVTLSAARYLNWNLLASSFGLAYGTDGTDCGIYGGSYPMPNMTGATTIPQMVSMDIQNSVIPVDGTLDVEIKSRNQK